MSLAVCFRNTVTVSHHEYFSALNGLKFVVCHTKSSQTFKVLLLYRTNNSNIHQYINSIQQILTTCPVDVILGDFNVDFFEDNLQIRELKMLMNSFNFTQIINSPTFVSSGSLIDHVFVSPGVNINQKSVVSVYYSDHEAIKISISFQ